MTRRVSNWPRHLADYLESRHDMPFEWGKNDCCLFVADWLVILTGIDPADELRGTYDDAATAGVILESHGGLESMVSARFAADGWHDEPPVFAQRGDIVTCDTPDGVGLGVCAGSTIAMPGKSGLVHAPMTLARKAWRIG